MAKKEAYISINLFKVNAVLDDSPSLSKIIEKVVSLSLEERRRPLNGRDYRLEEFKRGKDISWSQDYPQLMFFSMTNFREGHGPGKAGVSTPIENIDYGEEGFPTEDTAVMYDPENSYMLVQYSQIGPRSGTIRSYFNDHSGGENYFFEVTMEKDFLSRYQIQDDITKVEVKLDLGVISQNDVLGDKAAESAFLLGEQLGGATVSIVVSSPRGKSGVLKNAKGLINKVLRIESKTDGAATTLKSRGTVEGEGIQDIDLLGGKLSERIPVPVSRKNWRMDIESRWNALYKAYSVWKSRGYIKR